VKLFVEGFCAKDHGALINKINSPIIDLFMVVYKFEYMSMHKNLTCLCPRGAKSL